MICSCKGTPIVYDPGCAVGDHRIEAAQRDAESARCTYPNCDCDGLDPGCGLPGYAEVMNTRPLLCADCGVLMCDTHCANNDVVVTFVNTPPRSDRDALAAIIDRSIDYVEITSAAVAADKIIAAGWRLRCEVCSWSARQATSEADLFTLAATAQDKVCADGFNAVECRAIAQAILDAGWMPPPSSTEPPPVFGKWVDGQ